MKWYHRVDPTWLTARKAYLSASDVKKLLPFTPTGRPRTGIDEAYLKVWAEKQCRITEEDICSTGAMARGHLLEPYALEEFNKLGIMKLHHWDDTLVYSKDSMSTSPDALNVRQPDIGVELPAGAIKATHLGEVKCYSAAAHYEVGLAPKMTLEERWQIATAFYVIPTLTTAFLILFNPSATHPLFYHEYTRGELKDELDEIEKIVDTYWKKAATLILSANVLCPTTVRACCPTEDEIIAQLEEAEATNAGLNP